MIVVIKQSQFGDDPLLREVGKVAEGRMRCGVPDGEVGRFARIYVP